MKRFLLIVCTLGVFACNGKKNVDVSGITPSPFLGCWESVVPTDSIQNLSVCIGERGDSLLVAFFWERLKPFYMAGNPLSDSKGNTIPQACVPVPKSGNSAIGTIVNQYFSVFQKYPKNEYYPLVLELKSLDTLVFKISGEVNYWPASGLLVRKNSENYSYSTEVVDLYKENAFVPDADVSVVNKFDVSGITPTPFVGEWAWEKNGPWQDFSMSIAAKGDSLLLVAGGVFLGGTRMQMPDWDNDGTPLPQACLLAPTLGNIAVGRFFLDADCTVTLELFSKNTLLFKTGEQLGFWPDSAVMVRTSCDNSIFK
ncbi:MAG: hypothetical protein IKW46_02680 [Bacteroidaceae bacterium]|nr:hypothetical protein [Bacteroidaceae bacterium]